MNEPIYVGAPCRGTWSNDPRTPYFPRWSCSCRATKPEDCKAETADIAIADTQRMASGFGEALDLTREAVEVPLLCALAPSDALAEAMEAAKDFRDATGVPPLAAEIERLRAVNAELVAALQRCLRHFERIRAESSSVIYCRDYDSPMMTQARAALAKVGAK